MRARQADPIGQFTGAAGKRYIAAIMLQTGDPAPDFSLSDQDGNVHTLSSYRGRKLLIYFYPRADTPGCTRQSCAVRDARNDLASRNLAAVGISPDVPEDQKKFDDKFDLGFPLLADDDHKIAEAYGAWGEKKMYGRTSIGIKRSSFLVDENGNLEGVWYNVRPEATVPKALQQVDG